MDNEKLAEELREGRLLGATEGLLYPLLEKHAEAKVVQLCTKYNGGEKDFLAEVAQLAYIRGLLKELKRKQERGFRAYEKLNKNS